MTKTKTLLRIRTAAYAVAGVCVVGMSVLAGCSAQTAHSDSPPPPPKEFFEVHYQKVPDGRTVMCLYREVDIHGYAYGAAPAMSCDWANAIAHK